VTDSSPALLAAVTRIRAARRADADGLHRLSRTFVASRALRHRTPTEFEEQVGDFLAAEHGRRLVGCVGVGRLPGTGGAAVLYNLCGDAGFHGMGLGGRLVAASVRRAARIGAPLLYTATTRTDGWFERQCFRPVEPAAAPASWVADLDPSRGSLLYVRRVDC